MIDVVRTASEDAEFLALVALLDAELRVRDGDDHAFYAQFNKAVGLSGVVVAYVDGVAAGCGAFKKYDESTAEIKRMYVREGHRGKRLGSAILNDLESWARELCFSECILETGFKQPEAIALYKRSGYEVIPNYGQYYGVESSICLKKLIPIEK